MQIVRIGGVALGGCGCAVGVGGVWVEGAVPQVGEGRLGRGSGQEQRADERRGRVEGEGVDLVDDTAATETTDAVLQSGAGGQHQYPRHHLVGRVGP